MKHQQWILIGITLLTLWGCVQNHPVTKPSFPVHKPSLPDIAKKYEQVKQADTFEEYAYFLNSYPNSAFADEAKKRRDGKFLTYYENLKKNGTKKDYQDLLMIYPDNEFAEEAKKRLRDDKITLEANTQAKKLLLKNRREARKNQQPKDWHTEQCLKGGGKLMPAQTLPNGIRILTGCTYSDVTNHSVNGLVVLP